MVRKIICFVCLLAIVGASCATAQAATHSIYENGSLSSTYTTYFKDILSGASLFDNYVAFRSGQYEYTMITGNIAFDAETNTFTLDGKGTEYVFTSTSNNYNASYDYIVNDIDNFTLEVNNEIIYSNLGSFPQLIDRGTKYEILTTILVIVLLLSFVIRSIFAHG